MGTPTMSADAQAALPQLREQAASLHLHGLIAHWAAVMAQPEQAAWVAQMLSWEAAERSRRSLERRLRAARIGRFKPLADFDWTWPKQCDRGAIEELMTLGFLEDATNVVLVVSGPHAELLLTERNRYSKVCAVAEATPRWRRPGASLLRIVGC